MSRPRALRLGLWLLPSLTLAFFYLYRPFVLGFYSDDWGLLLEATNHGGPFSLERLDYTWQTFARPLMNLEVWLGSSIFGNSAIAWHFFLLALAAICYVMLRRLLLALDVRPAVATVASSAWLLFPWALGYRVWPTCSAVLISAIFFLAGSVALLKQRLWSATAWYAASLLAYEAFHLAFVPLLFIMAMSPRTRRWALLRAAPLFISLQVLLIVMNRLAAHFAPQLGKTYSSAWHLHLGHGVLRFPITLSEGLVGPRSLSIAIVATLLLVGLVAAVRTKSGERRVKLVAAVVGFLLACLVLAIAGYELAALNTTSRTFVGADIWLVVFLALAWSKPLKRNWAKWTATATVAAVLLLLAASTVIRADLWHRLWEVQKTVLRSIPVEEVESTGPEAVIVFRDFPTVDGFPPFAWDYVMTNAAANRPNGSRIERHFYPAGWGAAVSWDGKWLLRDASPVLEAPEVWLWRWPDRFESITSPQLLIDARGN